MGARGRLPGCHDLGPPPTLRRDDSAICYPDGLGVEAEMVSQGLACDCERFSGGRYRDAEQRAADGGATIGEVYPVPSYCRPR